MIKVLFNQYGMMACPGATIPERYGAAVILRDYNPYTSVIKCQVWARECWNFRIMGIKNGKNHFLFGFYPQNPSSHYLSIPIMPARSRSSPARRTAGGEMGQSRAS